MDLTTVLGLAMAIVLIGWSLTLGGSDLEAFLDAPSLVMVAGGTAAVTLIHFRASDLKVIAKVMMRSVLFRLPSPAEEIERILAYANVARRDGLLALEAKLKEVDDHFFSKGVQMVIDGFQAQTVRDILDLELAWQEQRHAAGKKMLDQMGTMAPAFGVIGTLVGLVQMLSHLNEPGQLGPGLAMALLTTFYGALLSVVVFIPLAGKLDVRAKEESLLRELMIEGIVAIQSGEKPQLIRQKLVGFLPPSAREAVAA